MTQRDGPSGSTAEEKVAFFIEERPSFLLHHGLSKVRETVFFSFFFFGLVWFCETWPLKCSAFEQEPRESAAALTSVSSNTHGSSQSHSQMRLESDTTLERAGLCGLETGGP